MADAPQVESTAARSTPQGQTENVLNSSYETREIIIAQGIDFTNADYTRYASEESGGTREMLEYCRVPQSLQEDFPDMTISGDQAEYVSEAQQVRFTIRIVNTKSAFKQALETAGVHVIYCGHARYGRGPCFGASPDPGEDWEQGANANTGGLWRFGFPIIGVHRADIRSHEYSFYPVAAGEEQPSRDDLHPDTPRRLRRGAPPEDLQAKVMAQGLPLAEEYWGYTDGDGEAILLHAGWENTTSDPNDLGATNLQCRCFSVFACSTFRHNWPILRRRRCWTRTDDDRFAYFTTAPTLGITTPCWLTALFTYSERNDFQSWYPSLQWSRDRASNLIRAKLRQFGESGPWRVI